MRGLAKRLTKLACECVTLVVEVPLGDDIVEIERIGVCLVGKVAPWRTTMTSPPTRSA
jgi:hypothetical protein